MACCRCCLEVIRKPRKVKKKILGGGRWRAWVRAASYGTQGSADLRAVAQRYRAARATGSLELDRAERLGALAATAAQQEGPGPGARQRTSFGVKSRRAATLRWQQQCRAFHTQHRDLNAFDKAQVCLSHPHAGGSLEAALRLARASARMQTAEELDQEQSEAEVLARFDKEQGQPAAQQMQATLPVLRRHGLKQVPMSGVTFFELESKPLHSSAMQVCSWMAGNRLTNFGPALDKWWMELHKAVDTGLMEPASNAVSLKPGRCQEAGICLCSQEGRQLLRCRNQLLKALKASFQVKKDKALLGDGHMFFKLTQSKAVEEEEETSLWFHISRVSWSPYKPTLQIVFPTTCSESAFFPDLRYVQVQIGQKE